MCVFDQKSRHPFFAQCVEDMIPELGHLRDSMKDHSPIQPTAASALALFEEVCMCLRPEDFERTVEATHCMIRQCQSTQ